MSKNKDKKGAQASAQSPKKSEAAKGEAATQQNKEKAVETKAEVKEKKGTTAASAATTGAQPKKETPKVEVPTPPAENANGDPIQSGLQEEVPVAGTTVMPTQAEMSAQVFQNAELQETLTAIALTPETTMDVNHMVDLAKVATERFKGKDQRNPVVIATNEMVDELTCYCIAIAGINMSIHGKKLGLSVPAAALPAYVRAMGYFGIALPEASAVPDPNKPGQLIIPFPEKDGISKETQESVKAEIKVHKNPTPTMDVSLWKSDEDAKKALSYILSDTLSKDNRFMVTTSKTRMYKVLNAANDEEKKMWEGASMAVVFENMLSLLGDSKTTLLNAVGGQIYSAAATQKNPILSHLTMKRNFPQGDDKDLCEMVKVLVKSKALLTNPDKPIESNISWIGLQNGKREDCLLIPTKSNKDDKEIMGRLQSHYGEKLGTPADKDYNLKATNLLATIVNLYKAEDFISQYNAADYTDCVNKALEVVSGKSAPKEDKELEPKPADKKAEEKGGKDKEQEKK